MSIATAPPLKTEASEAALQYAVTQATEIVMLEGLTASDAAGRVYPRTKNHLASPEIDSLAVVGLAVLVQNALNALRREREEDGSRQTVEVTTANGASAPAKPLRVMVLFSKISYQLANGKQTVFAEYTKDDCDYLAQSFLAEANGKIRVAKFMQKASKLLAERGGRVKELPLALQEKLAREWPL